MTGILSVVRIDETEPARIGEDGTGDRAFLMDGWCRDLGMRHVHAVAGYRDDLPYEPARIGAAIKLADLHVSSAHTGHD